MFVLHIPEAAGEIIGRFGGVQDLLSALRAFPDNKAIASNCCGALWSLAVSGMVLFLVHLIQLVLTVDFAGEYFKHPLVFTS